MNISLKDWKRLDRIRQELIRAIAAADNASFAIWCEYHKTGEPMTPESTLLLKFNEQIHNLRGEAGMLMDTHPQSEWLGGDSNNPNNHTLREPNCCQLPVRRFTKEEIAEANLECLGPAQWRERTTQSPES